MTKDEYFDLDSIPQDVYSLYHDRINLIASKYDLVLHEYPIAAPFHCYKCFKEILVFTWVGYPELKAPKFSYPIKTLHYINDLRKAKLPGDVYLVNTCPYCRTIQGDYFVHSAVDAPFFGVYGSNPDELLDSVIERLVLLDLLNIFDLPSPNHSKLFALRQLAFQYSVAGGNS